MAATDKNEVKAKKNAMTLKKCFGECAKGWPTTETDQKKKTKANDSMQRARISQARPK